MADECVFCKIIKGEIKADIVEEGDNFIVINYAHPIADWHCLILPKKHYITLLDLPSSLERIN